MPPASPPLSLSGYLTDSTGWTSSVVDLLETVPQLAWPESVPTYSRMRHDPQLQAVLNAYTLPIRAASWAVDPAGCRDEVVRLVADDLGLPVWGADVVPGAARRRGVRWEEHLRLALLHLVWGFMPFAQRYDIVGRRARLAELSERMPVTVADIVTDDDGSLRGIRQIGVRTSDELIPARNLVWYVHEREGAAWQGRSMLRAAYGPWLLKHEVLRVHATSIRRFGMGIPAVEAPPGGTPQQVAEAQQLASSMRAGEVAGMGLPAGFAAKLVGLTGSVPDALAFVRYLDAQMAQMALASVLNLDASPNGSRALGETFVGLLNLSQNAIAAEMANTVTGLSVQIVDYNWGEDEPAPRIVCADVGSRPEVTAESIGQLLASGALSADPELEAWVRERYRLPRRDPDTPQPPPRNPVVAGRPRRRSTRPVAAAAAGGLRRQSTTIEAAARTDFVAVQGEWETALDALVADWADIGATQRAELVEQVTEAVDEGDMETLAALGVTTTAAAELLAARMRDLADEAAATMRREAAEQDVTVDEGAVAVDGDRLDAIAATVAALIGSGLAGSAARKALQAWVPEASTSDVADATREHLESLTDAALRDQLGAALSAAQNEGRVAVMRANPPALMIASEMLDRQTCDPCASVDGTEYASLEEAAQVYANGGYSGCQGGLRCRGVLLALWTAEAAA